MTCITWVFQDFNYSIILHHDLNELTSYWLLNTETVLMSSLYWKQLFFPTMTLNNLLYQPTLSTEQKQHAASDQKAKGRTEERRNVGKNSGEQHPILYTYPKDLWKILNFNNSFICMRTLKINVSPWRSDICFKRHFSSLVEDFLVLKVFIKYYFKIKCSR